MVFYILLVMFLGIIIVYLLYKNNKLKKENGINVSRLDNIACYFDMFDLAHLCTCLTLQINHVEKLLQRECEEPIYSVHDIGDYQVIHDEFIELIELRDKIYKYLADVPLI